MSLLGEAPISRERLVRASLAVLLALGMTACGDNDQPEGYPSPIPEFTSGPPMPRCGSLLETFSVEENFPDGSADIVNDGFCVNVYGADEDSDGLPSAPITQIATGVSFDIDCYDAAETAFVSKLDDEPQAYVALSDEAIQHLNDNAAARKIARC